jgi:hypothetical protein
MQTIKSIFRSKSIGGSVDKRVGVALGNSTHVGSSLDLEVTGTSP